MAKALNVDESGYYTEEAKTVRQIINTSFWNEGKHFFAYGMNKNRTFRSEPTILPAVPACFKLLDKGKMNMVLSQYASNAFSTNWGTRIVRDDSPLFKPAGYHYGSVWPLFTGWTSLAEYAYGNYAQGYFHLMNNMDLYKNRALGFSEEVLNGAEYEPSGVCAHQCWSETMVLQPAIEGMLGLNVSMPEDKIELAPRLPVDWDSLTVQHIHAGNHILDFRMKRSPDNYDYNFSPSGNGNLDLDFLPSFPPGTLFTKLLLDGKQTPFTVIAGKQSATIITSINLNHDHNLVIFYKNGIEVVPLKADPEPGDPAAGLRIISTNFNLNTYEIELENKPGTHGVLTVYLHDKTPVNVENAAIIKKEGDYITLSVDFESGTENYHTKTVKITLNN
jgi:hypothetical protein